MITLKFGEPSMRSAKHLLDMTHIIIDRAKTDRVSVVVSAFTGVYHLLLESIHECSSITINPKMFIDKLKNIHHDLCADITKEQHSFHAEIVFTSLQPFFDEYEKMLNAVNAFGGCPPSVYCRIMGLGELLLSSILKAVLIAQEQNVCLLDSRKFIYTTGLQQEGEPDYEKSMEAFVPYIQEKNSDTSILLFPGSICTWEDDQIGLLGKNDSDFSAAVIAAGLHANKVEFWTDVDGIFTADPHIMQNALLVNDMSYEEAMELSFFGSTMLSLKAIASLSTHGIEAWIVNSCNPSGRGTRIGPLRGAATTAVRTITSLHDMAMISISGQEIKKRHGITARIFTILARIGIPIQLITQSNSDYTMSFCVKQIHTNKAIKNLDTEFEYEICTGGINTVEVINNCSIVSIIGDSLKQKSGVIEVFFDTLARYGIDILAIAENTSHCAVSIIVNETDSDSTIRIAHQFFFNQNQTIELFIFGVGTIGSCLLKQLQCRQKQIAEQNIDIKIMGIASKNSMLLREKGIDLELWKDSIEETEMPPSIPHLLQFVAKTKPLNSIFIDCTASEELPFYYQSILKAGMHIIAANRYANVLNMDFYTNLRFTANNMHRHFLYGVNVGSGLPIIDTIQNFIKSGDSLIHFSGIISSTLSYLFGRLDDGVPFSQAVLEAQKKGLTEPDLRDDLTGKNLAQKTLIIAREAGFKCEQTDITIASILPPDFDTSGSLEDFIEKLPLLDDFFKAKIAVLKEQGYVLRAIASITEGACNIAVAEIDHFHPLYHIRDGENAFVFYTKRYTPLPLIIRGYGSGPEVTATGIFADILRTVIWNPQ